MSGLDYYNCDCCGAGKVFYDANIDWEYQRVGQIRAICKDCYKNNIRIKILNSSGKEVDNSKDHNFNVHHFTEENIK